MPNSDHSAHMYEGTVYRMIETLEEDYPRIYWSSHKNKPVDWEKLVGMFMGELPVDTSYTSEVDIHVATRGQRIDVIDCQIHLLISQQARACFVSLDLPSVGFIPIKINGERWWCLDVDRVVDCLDKKKSVIEYFEDGCGVMRIAKYVFTRSVIADPVIFRIPENRPPMLFVTESVRQAVMNAALAGFEFIDYEHPPHGYLIG